MSTPSTYHFKHKPKVSVHTCWGITPNNSNQFWVDCGQRIEQGMESEWRWQQKHSLVRGESRRYHINKSVNSFSLVLEGRCPFVQECGISQKVLPSSCLLAQWKHTGVLDWVSRKTLCLPWATSWRQGLRASGGNPILIPDLYLKHRFTYLKIWPPLQVPGWCKGLSD